ncbi:hypothetical protein Nepgr_028092 [Nepenthes gracilis]|uniref:Plastid movement impaired 2 n=1 Tax=Nepenthes gracilis TaxID=150966 RepID=A0AAD3Y3R9_NEPGR|nr:hypothetical protein Nepgr_028092 [Nepenthes gracilis]
MGNSLGRKGTVKIMKISGETMKLKTPIQAGEIVKDYPGHVLLDSEAVRHYGVRAKPIERHEKLLPKRLYFLVVLPELPQREPRRVRSGIQMSAKDRLENLLLARRSNSDLSIMKPACGVALGQEGATRVRMRLPKAEVAKLMSESRNEEEAAGKIMDLLAAKSAAGGSNLMAAADSSKGKEVAFFDEHAHGDGTFKVRQKKKKVGFVPVNQREIRLAVAS